MITLSAFNGNTSIDQLVAQYRASISKPVYDIQNQRTTLNARLSALSTLKGKLQTLYSVSQELATTGTSSDFAAVTVSSSNGAVATATGTTAATLGTHSLLVTQLAKSDRVMTSVYTTTATDISTAEGAGSKTFSVTVNGVATNVNVAVAAGDTNSTVLSNMASAINAAGIGVSASVVNVSGTTARLVINGKNSGSTNAVSLADVTGTLLNNSGLTAAVLSGRTAATSTSAGYQQTATSALDANFQLDGISMTRGTNTVQDALVGVTLNLQNTQLPTDAPVSLTVGVDNTGIKANISKFIQAYNDALTNLTSQTAVDPTTHVRQILASDMTFRLLRVDLRTITGGNVSSVLPGNPAVLSDIGISTAADGTLSLADPTKVDAALANGSQKVSDLFNSVNGFATRLASKLSSFVSIGGIIDSTTTSISGQVTNMNDRITTLNAQIDKKANQFRDQYAQLQSALAIITQQQQTMQSLGW